MSVCLSSLYVCQLLASVCPSIHWSVHSVCQCTCVPCVCSFCASVCSFCASVCPSVLQVYVCSFYVCVCVRITIHPMCLYVFVLCVYRLVCHSIHPSGTHVSLTPYVQPVGPCAVCVCLSIHPWASVSCICLVYSYSPKRAVSQVGSRIVSCLTIIHQNYSCLGVFLFLFVCFILAFMSF